MSILVQNLFQIFLCFVLVGNVVSEVTNIHLIPHSHCDAGWIKTTDQYYEDQVKDILDRTIAYTSIHSKKYNWVETIFLHMWWNKDATEKQKDQLRSLINNGTWDIIMGGWVMTDEALTTYSAMIDVMTLGHAFLMNNLNVKPKRGFAIDPFGLSSVQAHLYAEMGFETHVIMRIPSYVKDEFRKTQNLEVHWSDSADPSKSIFTHILWNTYTPPMPFQYWNPGLMNPPVTPKNIKELSEGLLDFVIDNRLPSFRNKEHVFFPFGSDFAYTCPDSIYGNMSLLVDYINENYVGKYHLQYSTLTDYFDAILSSTTQYPVLQDNSFFVYSDDEFAQWSGYYTSQPRLKIQARRGEYLSRMMEQIYSFTYISQQQQSMFSKSDWNGFYDTLFLLRDKIGQLQHHDAITGTCKFFVTDFYCNELEGALTGTWKTTQTLLSTMISRSLFYQNKNQSFILNSDQFTTFDTTIVFDGDEFGMYVYNSLGWNLDGHSITVQFTFENNDDIDVKVTDLAGNVYPSQVIPTSTDKTDQKEIMIEMTSFPPVGYQYIIVSVHRKKNIIGKKKIQKEEQQQQEIGKISNDVYDVFFDPETNKISMITNKISQISMNVSFDFLYYFSFYSIDPLEQSGGAYIFRPKDQTPSPVSKSPPKIDMIIKNDLVTEIHQTICEYIKIIIRLFKTSSLDEQSFVEFEFTQLGEIPTGYEIVMRAKTEIENKQVMYHDELAFEMKRREYNRHETKELVASNFYPMQYSAFIKSEEKKYDYEGSEVQFSVLSSKSQGVSSQSNGEIEMMLHRTTVFDDLRGVFQPLLDPYVVSPKDGFKMRFVLDTVKRSIKIRKRNQYDLNFPAQTFFNVPSLWNIKSYPKDFAQAFSFLKSSNSTSTRLLNQRTSKKSMKEEKDGGDYLPDNLHLVTIAAIDQVNNPNEFVCRWLNIYEKWESTEPVSFDVSNMFITFPSKITKMTLSLLHDVKDQEDSDGTMTSLNPLQFGTYKMEF